jgi:hypothetical protein
MVILKKSNKWVIMRDDEFSNITLTRMELYALIGALELELKKNYDKDIDDEAVDETSVYYKNLISMEEKLLKRLEIMLGE